MTPWLVGVATVYSAVFTDFRDCAQYAFHVLRVFYFGPFNLVGEAESPIVIGAFVGRERCQQVRLRGEFIAHFLIQRFGHLAQIHIHVARRTAEPAFEVPVQNRNAPQHQEENRQRAERDGAADQFGLYVRAGAVALPLHVQLQAGAEAG